MVAAYLELRDHLAPGTAEGTERLRFLLEHVPRATQGLEELFLTTAAQALDHDVADRALIAAASFAMARSDLDTAYDRLREALVRRRGSDTAIERAACIGLARVLRLEGRSAEALLLARRATTMVVSGDEPRGRIAAQGALAGTLLELGERVLAADAAQDLGALLPRDGNDAGAVAVRGMLARLRVDIALRARRFDEALWRIDALFARENPTEPRRRASLTAHRAHVLLDAGRGSEATLALQEARRLAPESSQDDMRLATLEARAAVAMDDTDRARERAERALAQAVSLVDTPGPHRFWAGELVSVFAHLGDMERERRCLEIVATEHLEQLARVDRTADEIPELAGEIHAEDRAILRRARERALVESRDTLAAFASLLAPAIRDGDARALVLTPGGDDLIRVCAWCARVAGRDGKWLPLGHMIPTIGKVRATHGMCPDCVADSPAAAAIG